MSAAKRKEVCEITIDAHLAHVKIDKSFDQHSLYELLLQIQKAFQAVQV